MHSFPQLKYILVLSLLMVFNNSSAQSVADLWISMPDELVPYLTLNQKKEMIECRKIGVDSKVKNKLQGDTDIDTLSADYGKFIVSNSREIEMVKLPTKNDSILLVIDTYKGPLAHSKAAFYTLEWGILPSENVVPQFQVEDFILNSDTLTAAEQEEILSICSHPLYSYSYDKSTGRLIVKLSLPSVTLDDKKRIEEKSCKKMLIWTGEMFTNVI